LIAIGPFPAEQTRAAVAAKRFYCAFPFAVDLDQFSALYEMKLSSPYPRLCAHGCTGMFTAAITVTMIRLNKRRFYLKLDSAAQATATNPLTHGE
jgi:hypothetical protein